ncbi:MAG: phospho-N-acetylmuramoyl-pentapeptide-transferase [Bacteroidota bacterium]
MLYYFFKWLSTEHNVSGTGIFQFLTFRIALAVLLSLIVSMWFGKRIIRRLQKLQIGESVRELGLPGEVDKANTPTMGGFIILLAILIPTLLFAKLSNVYVVLILLVTVWCGGIGFIDDVLKIRAKRKAKAEGRAYKKADADGLAGRFKIAGQVGLGLIVGTTLYFSPYVWVEREIYGDKTKAGQYDSLKAGEKSLGETERTIDGEKHRFVKVKTPITTIPFVKNHEFNYSKLLPKAWEDYTYILYIFVVIFIITAVSNGSNITDGLDGLATGTSAIIGIGLGLFAYVSGNIKFAEYLNIMYIPNLGELTIFIGAFIGACIGFLWYNSFPAQVFMGDTGSLALGGIIASLAIMVRKELLIPIFCLVFFIESLSVMIQVGYFKYTKKKYGEGRRVFLMSPVHHHYQKLGYHESKIATRFWIVTILCVVMSVITLKIR